ncbi:hypothetical protein YC2023_006742 [Brassica napus]
MEDTGLHPHLLSRLTITGHAIHDITKPSAQVTSATAFVTSASGSPPYHASTTGKLSFVNPSH